MDYKPPGHYSSRKFIRQKSLYQMGIMQCLICKKVDRTEFQFLLMDLHKGNALGSHR